MNANQNTNPFEIIDQQLKSIQSELLDIKHAISSTVHQEKKYYTIAEAALKLNVSQITVYRNAHAGKIPTKRIGSRVMIPGSFLDKWSTTMKSKGEVRVPARLLATALHKKEVKALRLLVTAKLQGHRCEISFLRRALKIKDRTCRRLVTEVTEKGWAGADNDYVFPRAWRKMSFNKRGGLYLINAPRDPLRFEALCFAFALKKIYRRRGSPHSIKGRVKQKDFPARYLCEALGVSERRLTRLKRAARKYKFISITRRFSVVGKAVEIDALRKNLKGVGVFAHGKNALVSLPSRIRIHL